MVQRSFEAPAKEIASKAKLSFFDFSSSQFYLSGVGLQRTGLGDDGRGNITYVDGDTTHFRDLQDGFRAAVRYHGIDTPESTGSIQKWGKAASNFTRERLSAATSVVLTNHTMVRGEPDVDANGRYLAYVWYATVENASAEDYVLLNLEIVANGYSAAKGVDPSNPFYSHFLEADDFARKNELHTYAKADFVDPLFHFGRPEKTTLKNLSDNRWAYVDEQTGESIAGPVRVEGVITALSGANAYIQDDFDGVSYGLYLFVGYKPLPPLTKVGARVSVAGQVESFQNTGSLQMKGLTYGDLVKDEEKDSWVIEEGQPFSVAKLGAKEELSSLNDNTAVSVDSIKIVYGYGGTEEVKPEGQSPNANNDMTLFGILPGAEDVDQNRVPILVPSSSVIGDASGAPIKDAKRFVGKDVRIANGIVQKRFESNQILIPDGNSLQANE